MHLRKRQTKWLNGRSIPLFDSPNATVRKVLAVCPSVDRAVLPLAVLILLVVSCPRIYAGQFVNLDFESPRLPLNDLAALSVDALPGWAVNAGVLGNNRVFVNSSPLSGAAISFYGPLTDQPNSNHDLYSARLYSGYILGVGVGVSIWQSGNVPESAKSLRLEARSFQGYQVTLDGTPIAMSRVQDGVDYDTYYGDISGFSGQAAELKIQTVAGPGFLDGGPYLFIDKISFSTLVVPEPGVYALLGVGLFGLGCWRRWRA